MPAAVRRVFAQPDGPSAAQQRRRAVTTLRPRLPKIAEMLRDAEAELLAQMNLPAVHWRQIRSTNGLEGGGRQP